LLLPSSSAAGRVKQHACETPWFSLSCPETFRRKILVAGRHFIYLLAQSSPAPGAADVPFESQFQYRQTNPIII